MSDPPLASVYDQDFYAAQTPGSARSAAIALGRLFEWVRPASVADVGCGTGAWLAAARKLGAREIVGFDGDHVAPETLLIPPERFVPVQLECEDASATLAGTDCQFDMVMSLEVAEHLPHARSAGFVADLTRLGDLVLFSAALPFQNGTGHINEQWAEFWAILFRAQGFACFDALRPYLRTQEGVDWWYAQNILLFARRGSAAEVLLPAASRNDGQPLSQVHPLNLLAQTLWNFRPQRVRARGVEEADFHAVDAAWRSKTQIQPPVLQTTAHDAFPATRTLLGDPEAELRKAHAARALAEGTLREADFRIEALRRRCAVLEAGRTLSPPAVGEISSDH